MVSLRSRWPVYVASISTSLLLWEQSEYLHDVPTAMLSGNECGNKVSGQRDRFPGKDALPFSIKLDGVDQREREECRYSRVVETTPCGISLHDMTTLSRPQAQRKRIYNLPHHDDDRSSRQPLPKGSPARCVHCAKRTFATCGKRPPRVATR